MSAGTEPRGRIEDHPFLRGLDPDLLRELATMAEYREFEPGAKIAHQGTPAVEFFLLLRGKVALEEVADPTRPHLTVQTVGPGELLGWSWLLGHDRWRFDARALKPTAAWRVDALRCRALLDARPQVGYQFLLRMLPVIAERLEHTRLQLLDIYAP
jgi:CRP/FNR family transcriptional regulator, cyclic AMP receptor protein